MASQMKTFKASFSGGLDTRSTLQGLQSKPGLAISLKNFEQNIGGGYRRINGFTTLSDTAVPGGTTLVRGIYLYRDGVVVCKGNNIYHTFDRVTWTQVNKNLPAGGNLAALNAAASLPRTGTHIYSFDTFTHGAAGGVVDLLIHDGGSNPAILTITGGSTGDAVYTYSETALIDQGSVGLVHSDQRIVAGDSDAPSTFYVSAIADMGDFSGTLSGAYSVADPIVGLKSFRNALYIFCENSVWKAEALNSAQPNIQPVFRNIGCVANSTIQEVGGDIVFLATDGLRTLGATSRIGDVNIPSTSLPISGLIQEILQSRDSFTFTSMVLRERNQYRLFYTNQTNDPLAGRGIIATYYPNKGLQSEWSFSETEGMGMTCSHASIQVGTDIAVHGDQRGEIYLHDTGSDFNGTAIEWEMQTPYFDMGDVGLRKNARELIFYLEQEGTTSINVNLDFDYESQKVHQPAVYPLESTTSPAIWGEMVWGDFTWGSSAISVDTLHVQGSFQTISLRIANGAVPNSAPFTIQGFTMNYTEGSRI